MTVYAYPWLVADVGGTNARFGLVSGPGRRPETIAVLNGADHEGLPEAVAAYLAEHAGGVRPGAACIAIAGPVDGDRYHLTNAGWSGSAHDLGLPNAHLLNDFEALALALPHLGADDLEPLGGPAGPGGDGRLGEIKAVLGPGTGLGVGGLVRAEQGWVPIPSEGGHSTAPAVTDLELDVVRALHTQGMPHVVAEHLLSGPGLSRLHHALALVHGVDAEQLAARDIVSRAADGDTLSGRALDVFCALLGSFAGNIALILGARGGVYLGGGIVPRILDRLRGSDFRARFEATPKLGDYLGAISTYVIVDPQPALTGAAGWLAQRSGR
ncbi:hypothetical protein Misp01_17420 [Microtetraspora sp. NBRC 13810]|uniref:glucokinase n=1 Tax=Microtetraspora sp. NBRC 13810 TaxID=3030990 RepID=UPI0024A55505|nr:glucokinase [Microtetraspora sp. NBRC 13810]GLW06612.1 hypothetical protein Misp01_17420 [Microtetraspora sp. NBRC 13810]